MSQIKQSKMRNMSVSIPKLESKRPSEHAMTATKVRQGAISKSIPPLEPLSKKESIINDMSYMNSLPKPKKSIASHFNDSQKHTDHTHKHSDLLKPRVKPHLPNSIPNNSLLKSSAYDQALGASFKTKAEKKSMLPEKSDEKIGEDSNGYVYSYSGGKKIFKTSQGKSERELASSGSKDCMKLIKNLKQSNQLRNQSLITKLEDSVYPRIQQTSKNKIPKEGHSLNSDNPTRSDFTASDSKQHLQDKKSSHKIHSSLLENKESKPKKSVKKNIQNLLTDSNSSSSGSFSKISPGYDGHTQVHSSSSMRKDTFLAKSRENLEKPPFLSRQHPTFLEHTKSPELSCSPYRLSKQSSIEATNSPVDKKRIDPSHFPNETQRKKRGRPPGSTDKSKKKLSKPLSLIPSSRGRPKKNILGITPPKTKPSIPLSRQIKPSAELFSKLAGIRASKETKHQVSDNKKVTYEVQETSESMSVDGKRKQAEELIRAEQKRKESEREKLKPMLASKDPLTSYPPKLKEYKQSPINKRPHKLSTSSEEEETPSLKPPPRKSPNYRDFSDSEVANVPKTPGATSCPPPNPWEKMEFETKDDTFKSSSPLSSSPLRKSTDMPVIGLAPSRGKYMPKRQDSGHQLAKHPSSDQDIFEFKSHGAAKDPTRIPLTGKKIATNPSSKSISGQKQAMRPKLHESSKEDLMESSLSSNLNQSSLGAESSGESSSGESSSGSESSSSSEDSDDESHVPSSLPPQPSNPAPTVMPAGPARASEVPEQPRVAFVFTTELANKAATAVIRGEVRTIVDFHKNNQASLSHLKLSSQRKQNLEKRNKSPGQNGNGTHLPEKTMDPLPEHVPSSSSNTSSSESETSEAESRPPSPLPSKPIEQPVQGMDESNTYNSYESSDDQQESSNCPQMIPKTPGPPTVLAHQSSDEDSEDDEVMRSPRPMPRPYHRGKSRMNMIAPRDVDTADMQDGLNMVPKTPGAGLASRDMDLSDDDDNDDEVKRNEIIDKDLSDEEKTFATNVEFDKPPRAPRPPQLSDDEEEARGRLDLYSRPTSPQFENIIKGLNSAQHLPIHEISPSISPLDLHITPRQSSPSQNPPSAHGTSSNNPSSKNTPTIIPSNESYSSQQTSCAKLDMNVPLLTPRDSVQYNYPSTGGGQFMADANLGKGLPLSHYSSPSRTPMHATPPTPSHQPSALQEAIAAPYRTPESRRGSYIQPSLLDHVVPDLGMLQTGRKESIDAGTAVYPVRPPISTSYLYPSRPQPYQGNPSGNMAFMPQHTRDMFLANPTQFNDSSPPLYPQELPSEIPGLTSRYPHPTDALPVSMQPAGAYYPTGYPTQLATPRHELQPQELAYINRPIAPVYANGDNDPFNGMVRKQVPPTNLKLSDRQESLVRTFSGVSASNLQGTPLDTNLEKLAPSLPMTLSEIAQQDLVSTPLKTPDNFSFTEPEPSPKKIMASCSTSPPPQPAPTKPTKPPKPEMVDQWMQTDGDDTWDNSKPDMDTELMSMEVDPSIPITTSSATTSTECQTELSPVKVLDSAIQSCPEPSIEQKPVEQKEEKEDIGFIIRIPINKISKETKFLHGNLADDFVNIAELPKLTPLNPKDRDRHFQAKLGAENIAIIRSKHCEPPPLRLLFNSQKGMPQLTPIKKLISNGFHTPPPSELDFRDLPKLRPLIPLLLSNKS